MEYYEPIDRLLTWCESNPGTRVQYQQELSGIADQYNAYALNHDKSVAESVITDGITALEALQEQDRQLRLTRLKACSAAVLVLGARDAESVACAAQR